VKVLFVCGGNTCRSPFAAGYARTLGLDAESAGLYVNEAEPFPEGVEAASRHGVDLSAHRARSVSGELLGGHDVVVTMTRSQLEAVGGMGAERARTLLDDADVADPYGRGPAAYEATYAQIAGAMPALVEELRA
jgi:protein-tyrosine phosphatase